MTVTIQEQLFSRLHNAAILEIFNEESNDAESGVAVIAAGLSTAFNIIPDSKLYSILRSI